MEVLLWCWDARMTWDDEPQAISYRMASPSSPFPYLKKPESFLVGFKRLIDYAARVGVRGIIVWGFLREGHGGVQAAVELCRYARDRGVAVIPGVGVCSYGGFYYDGDHPFNLASYLRRYPDRASKATTEGRRQPVSPVLDPTLEANQRWWRDGLEWMLQTVPVDGLNFEMGDFLVNTSPAAQQARQALNLPCDDNLKDLVLATRGMVQHATKLAPRGLFINSTYRGYHQIRGFPRLAYVAELPPQTIWQYTLTQMVREADFAVRFADATSHRRYGYLHWFNSSTRSADKDYVAQIARVWPGAHRLGFEFIGTYGELSATRSTIADRNYRAQVAWGRDPDLRLDDFR
jgi:hypothetical protein